MKCPKCNCTAYVGGGKDTKGRQVHICKHCNRKYIDPELKIRSTHNAKCPDCSCPAIKSGGKTKLGIQRYICKRCGRSFQLEPTTRAPKVSKEKIVKIKLYLGVKGLKIKDICKAFGVGKTTVTMIKRELIKGVR